MSRLSLKNIIMSKGGPSPRLTLPKTNGPLYRGPVPKIKHPTLCEQLIEFMEKITKKKPERVLVVEISPGTPVRRFISTSRVADPLYARSCGRRATTTSSWRFKDGDDYSASRGLIYTANRVLRLDGLVWNTARISQHADRFADNVCIVGDYQQPVKKLWPLVMQEYSLNPTNDELEYKLLLVDPTIKPEDLPFFPEGRRK